MRKRTVVARIDVWPVIENRVWRDNNRRSSKPAAHEFLRAMYVILCASESKPRWKKDILETVEEK